MKESADLAVVDTTSPAILVEVARAYSEHRRGLEGAVWAVGGPEDER